MILKPHQDKTVKEAPNKWSLFFRQRVGKTPTAIRLATSRTQSALIISPKQIVEHWKKEIIKWSDKPNFDFQVISKETFRRDWKKLPRYDSIVIDECHRAFANYKTQLFKAGDNYIKKHNIQYIWLLSGTPFTSSSWCVYSYGKLLGKPWNWYKWNKMFFYDVMMGRRRVPMPKSGMDGHLQKLLRSLGTIIDLKDVADVPEDEEEVEYFKLNPEQKSTINNLEDTMAITRYTHTHELESGVLKSDGYADEISMSCDKDNRILELVEDNDKIVIVARYLAQIEKYRKLLVNNGKQVFVISGQIKTTASEVACEAENCDKAIVLIQSDTCEGYSLKSFNTVVFASLSYSFVNLDQMKYRVKAMEKTTPCSYIYLLTEGKSMDKAVYDCVSKKQDFTTNLFTKK